MNIDPNVINGAIANGILAFTTIVIPGSIFFVNICRRIDSVGMNVKNVADDIEKMSKQVEKIECKGESTEAAVHKLNTSVGVLQVKVDMLEKNNEKHLHS